jgi:hypothetical protein
MNCKKKMKMKAKKHNQLKVERMPQHKGHNMNLKNIKGTFIVTEPLRNEGSVFQDPDRVILDEARMHVNTHTKHLKP